MENKDIQIFINMMVHALTAASTYLPFTDDNRHHLNMGTDREYHLFVWHEGRYKEIPIGKGYDPVAIIKGMAGGIDRSSFKIIKENGVAASTQIKVRRLSPSTLIKDCSMALWKYLNLTKDDVDGRSPLWGKCPTIGDLDGEVWMSSIRGYRFYGADREEVMSQAKTVLGEAEKHDGGSK